MMFRSIRIMILSQLILWLTMDLISHPTWQKIFCNPGLIER